MKKIICSTGAIFIAVFIFLSSGAKALTINFVTDIQASNKSLCTLYKCLPRWKSAFQTFLDNTSGMIITVGDNTDDRDKSVKNELLQMTAGREIYWGNGNHDKTMYLGGAPHYVIDKDDWRIIILRSSAAKYDSELKWLREQMKGYEDKKVMIVEHHPIFRWNSFEVVPRHKKIKKIYEQYNVDWVFSGHWHSEEWAKEIKGVNYRAFKALTYGRKTHYYTLEFE